MSLEALAGLYASLGDNGRAEPLRARAAAITAAAAPAEPSDASPPDPEFDIIFQRSIGHGIDYIFV